MAMAGRREGMMRVMRRDDTLGWMGWGVGSGYRGEEVDKWGIVRPERGIG